jgi:hypothetical protein
MLNDGLRSILKRNLLDSFEDDGSHRDQAGYPYQTRTYGAGELLGNDLEE